MDDEHVLAFIEAVDWTHLDAIHVFAFDAGFVDDVSHGTILAEKKAKRRVISPEARQLRFA
jgi:hypothetical protein